MGVFGLGFLFAGCCGVLVLLAGAGALVYFLMRKKKPPRGFDVEPKDQG